MELEQMTRIRRWLNKHGKEFLADGTLKEEIRQLKLAQGRSLAAIEDYAARLKDQYDEWKHLDEIDPEPWVEYTAWDLFSEEEKKKFNPDGTLKQEYIEYARRLGLSEEYLEQLEYKKKLDVESFNRLSETWAARGINFGESQMRSRLTVKDYAKRQEQLEQDIRNGEEISSLSMDVEPDEYYQQHGYSSASFATVEKIP